MIEVAHLTRRFGGVAAVDDLTFSLERGEVVGFLGPNGAGKTTTMRILTGYLPATRAEVLRVAGHDVLRESMAVRRRIGYLPEAVPLYPELRVREMMRFHGRLHGMERGALKKRIPEVLERVGVRDRETQLVGKLSRGLKQRVGIAVALLPEPDVLILDEPTSGLDPIQRREVRALVRELSDDHTVLLSSHILAEIESVAPRVIIIDRGRLVADGTQQQLVERLGGRGHVRFEAFVPDRDEARELLASLDGVTSVEVGARVGIHQGFRITGEGDLREDVGALAMARSWAVRELSLATPTLEEIFTRLVLGEEAALGAAAPADDSSGGAPIALHVSPELRGAPELRGGPDVRRASSGAAAAAAAPRASEPAAGKTIYSLNPFDRGAARDLSKPMRTGEAPEGDDASGDDPAAGRRASP